MEKCLEILEKLDHKKQTEFSGVKSDFFRINSNFFGVGSTVDGEKYKILRKLDHNNKLNLREYTLTFLE